MNEDKKILRKLNRACNGDVSEIAEHIFADSIETVANGLATVASSKRIQYLVQHSHACPYVARVGKSYILALAHNCYVSVENAKLILHKEMSDIPSDIPILKTTGPATIYSALFALCDGYGVCNNILLHNNELVREYVKKVAYC